LRDQTEAFDESDGKIVLTSILSWTLAEDVADSLVVERLVGEIDDLLEEPVRFREVIVEEEVRLRELEFIEVELASGVNSNDVGEGEEPAAHRNMT
jgi:hypothetical protein